MRLRREKPGIAGLDDMVRVFYGDEAAAEWKVIVLKADLQVRVVRAREGTLTQGCTITSESFHNSSAATLRP